MDPDYEKRKAQRAEYAQMEQARQAEEAKQGMAQLQGLLGGLGGGGAQIWYRFPSFAFLELCGPGVPGCNGKHAAYIQGNNSNICDTGSGATACIVGKFKHVMATGTVGAGVGSGTGN